MVFHKKQHGKRFHGNNKRGGHNFNTNRKFYKNDSRGSNNRHETDRFVEPQRTSLHQLIIVNLSFVYLCYRRENVYNSLKEQDLGITEYVGCSEGFKGIIKSRYVLFCFLRLNIFNVLLLLLCYCRYSDFHVNEIDLDGNVATLTDLSLPIPPKSDEEKIDVSTSEERLVETALIPREQWDKIKVLCTSEDKLDYSFVEIDVTALEKNQRTEIHNSLKKIYGKTIVTNTTTQDEKKFIKCTKYTKGGT